MNNREYSLSLVSLATIVLGMDYAWNFIPGLPGFFSLNRFILLGIFLLDILLYSRKYTRSARMYLVCGVMLIGCLPFFLFEGNVLGGNIISDFSELAGIFVCLLFFYFNCTDAKAASRIMTILFLSSGLIGAYVMGSQLGILGGKIQSWRGDVEFTSASGIFDRNIITLYFLPAFAFGPMLKFQRNNHSSKVFDAFIILYIWFCFTAFFFLNSRAGSLATATSLLLALVLRYLIVPRGERGGRFSSFLFATIVLVALLYTQVQYNIFGTIIAIYHETDLVSDTSFAVRLASYRYLWESLIHSPNIFGGGYRHYWSATGWVRNWPHAVFVDVYIQGGLLFLLTYLYLLFGGMIVSLRNSLTGDNLRRRSCFAGFFCFLAGLLALAVTLTIGGYKLPWAIMACIFGLAAGGRVDRSREPAN